MGEYYRAGEHFAGCGVKQGLRVQKKGVMSTGRRVKKAASYCRCFSCGRSQDLVQPRAALKIPEYNVPEDDLQRLSVPSAADSARRHYQCYKAKPWDDGLDMPQQSHSTRRVYHSHRSRLLRGLDKVSTLGDDADTPKAGTVRCRGELQIWLHGSHGVRTHARNPLVRSSSSRQQQQQHGAAAAAKQIKTNDESYVPVRS